jgi:hypothetical protein
MWARNQVDGIGLSYRPASSFATQFQTQFLESIPRPIAGLKFPTQEVPNQSMWAPPIRRNAELTQYFLSIISYLSESYKKSSANFLGIILKGQSLYSKYLHDFFTVNPFWVGDYVGMHHLISDAYAASVRQFLKRTLSARIRSWPAHSVHASVPGDYESVPGEHAQCTYQFLTRILWVYKMNVWKMEKLLHMLSLSISNWCVWSGCASVLDTHAQCRYQLLTRILSVRIKVGACA